MNEGMAIHDRKNNVPASSYKNFSDSLYTNLYTAHNIDRFHKYPSLCHKDDD